MCAKLLSYDDVPTGFEMVVGGEDLEELVPVSYGGCWNLWFNVTLTDDPEATSWLVGLVSR